MRTRLDAVGTDVLVGGSTAVNLELTNPTTKLAP